MSKEEFNNARNNILKDIETFLDILQDKKWKEDNIEYPRIIQMMSPAIPIYIVYYDWDCKLETNGKLVKFPVHAWTVMEFASGDREIHPVIFDTEHGLTPRITYNEDRIFGFSEEIYVCEHDKQKFAKHIDWYRNRYGYKAS